jgi:hypothetical protein
MRNKQKENRPARVKKKIITEKKNMKKSDDDNFILFQHFHGYLCQNLSEFSLLLSFE